MRRRARQLATGLFVLLFALLIMAFYWMDFRTPKSQIGQKLHGLPYQSRSLDYQGRSVHYVTTGDQGLTPVIFVHGAPGDWSAFAPLMRDEALRKETYLISVDRLGYGHSDFGNTETSIRRQAEALLPILDTLEQPAILVGHSFGGPIAAQMAALRPDKVRLQLLIAPALDPDYERILWVSYPADSPWLRWAVPPVWRVTNEEKLAHVAELKKMLPLWKQITTPTVLLHGRADYLVPIENSYFGHRQMKQAPVDTIFPANLDHLIPFTHPEVVRKVLLDYL